MAKVKNYFYNLCVNVCFFIFIFFLKDQLMID